MSKIANIIMWSLNIIVYTLNILVICTTGATLINSICGWASSIILAIGLMTITNLNIKNNSRRLEYKNEQTTN